MDRQQLIEVYGDPVCISNGTVVQIYKDALNEKKGTGEAVERVVLWAGQVGAVDATRMKIKRLLTRLGKLRGGARDALEKDIFEFPNPQNVQVEAPTPSAPAETTTAQTLSKSTQKELNLLQHQSTQRKKQLSHLGRKIDEAKQALVSLKQRKGHYSLQNVKKREARNVSTQKALRSEKLVFKIKCSKQEKQIADLEAENKKLRQELEVRKVVSEKEQAALMRERESMRELKEKQRKAEKRASFHKRAKQHLDRKVKEMAAAADNDETERVRKVMTMEGGRYVEGIRLCVMELAALEVATGNMAAVMESVAHVCGTRFSSLPSRKACQNMLDEGQYIAQRMIADKVKKSDGVGLHKDGTTRRKVKILDSTISFDDGTTRSLGYSSVASETGEAIAETSKEKMKELSEAMDEEGFEVDMVEKLRYFMNDRAGNEKKSSRLLEEWRQKMLDECGKEQGPKIHHLFCTAHVLLGFQTYVLKALSFLNPGQAKHPILLLLRDAADLFGPVGDYRGCRNVWNGFCIREGLKSTIQNFKDNRFNGLFEVSAQVHHHHTDFLEILKTSTNNAKQQRLQKALGNTDLMDAVKVLGLFFFKFTGPFWAFAVSKSKASDLPSFIQKFHSTLKKVSQDPNFIFNTFEFLANYETTTPHDALRSMPTSSDAPNTLKLISTIASAMNQTIEVQMPDMLPGGKYGTKEGADTLKTASFAPLNNLSCERHFGAVDSGQRRRPRASLHHLTSLIMLKQNRSQLRSFCRGMSVSQKKLLWARAVRMGKALRDKHREADKKVLMDSLNSAFPKPKKPAAKSKRRRREPSPPTPTLPPPTVQPNDLIAVACEDQWYPALVLDTSGKDVIKVDFADLGKNLGVFKWPCGHDIHEVSRNTIIWGQLDVQPTAGGRAWLVTNAKAIQSRFQK